MSIDNHSSENLSELISLWVIPVQNVVSLPDPDSDFEVDFNDFSLKSGKTFEKIYFSPNSGVFSEDTHEHRSGPFVEKTIQVKIPKTRSEVVAWLNEHRYYYHYAVIEDANGEFLLVGEKMSLKFNRVSPKSSNEFGGYELTFTCMAASESPHINNCSLT